MSDEGNNLTRAEAATRAGVISDVGYQIDLDLTRGDEEFLATTTVRFRYADAPVATFIDLTGLRVESLTLNGESRGVDAFTGDRLPLQSLASENVVVITSVMPYSRAGVGLHRFVDPVDDRVYLHTQFEPFDAHRVFACFDQPDLKATYELTVRAPEGWVVVSNEAAREQPSAGEAGMWRFGVTPKLSTYLVAVVAGHYRAFTSTHGDLALGLYCRESLAEYLDADEFFAITRQGLDFFSGLFDYPYPFTKYDQLMVPEFNAGAMEHPGCVTFTELFIFRSRTTEAAREGRAGTILHEMAHMWFGDLVTMRWWDDLWLNESFATYMGNRAVAEATRFTSGWVRFAAGKSNTYAADQLPTTHPISADIVDTKATRLHFDGITYGKGAAVMRQLAAWVGTDAFDEGIRRYFKKHEWGNAALADFLDALAEASGRDLTGWSKEWLETAGVNTIQPLIEVDDAGAYHSVALEQTAAASHPTIRSHRLRVGAYDTTDDGLTRRPLVELDVVGPMTAVADLQGTSAADLLVANDDDLAYAKVRLDPRSFAALQSSLSALPDLTRSVVWAAASDMVREAELSASAFVDLVATHIATEPDLATVQRLIGQAATAVEVYGAPAKRLAARSRMASLAKAQLAQSEPGSEEQLVWARAWMGMADDDADLDAMWHLLDGRDLIDGLALDVDMRWLIVGVLATHGAVGAEVVEAEVGRDPTDIGRRRADSILAGRPDADGKEAAWKRATTDTAAPLAVRRTVAAGIWQSGQEELLRPFVAAYADELASWLAGFDSDVALSLARNLLPATVREEATVTMLRSLLAGGALNASARRVVTEGLDGIERALRAQAIDA